MKSLVSDLVRSPIMKALVFFSAIFVMAFLMMPADIVNDVLDSFALTASGSVLFRYWRAAVAGLRMGRPDAPDVMIVGGTGVVLSIALLRLLRKVGLEFEMISSPVVAYIFGAFTVLMVFSLFLKASAPPFWEGEYRLSPMATVAVGIASGGLLSVLLIGFRLVG